MSDQILVFDIMDGNIKNQNLIAHSAWLNRCNFFCITSWVCIFLAVVYQCTSKLCWVPLRTRSLGIQRRYGEWAGNIIDWCRASLQELSYSAQDRNKWNQIIKKSLKLHDGCWAQGWWRLRWLWWWWWWWWWWWPLCVECIGAVITYSYAVQNYWWAVMSAVTSCDCPLCSASLEPSMNSLETLSR